MITKGAKPVNQKEKMVIVLHLPQPLAAASGEAPGWHLLASLLQSFFLYFT
jgi:hypothetical protein